MRKSCLFEISLVTLFIGSSCSKEKIEVKPNFIIILADDMGWGDPGCYGSKFHETPNIDKLASEGVMFNQAYAACQVSSPTRASILTGKYPARLGITDWIPGRQAHKISPFEKLVGPEVVNQLNLSEITIAESLKDVGYSTAHIGKWHLGHSEYYPQYQGFDINVTGNHRGSPPSYFFPYKNVEDFNVLIENGKEGDYLSDKLTDEAIKFIEGNKEQKFFLNLDFYSVHIPLEAKDSLVKKYEEKLKTSDDSIHKNPVYAAMMESFDYNVGRLMMKLDELGLSENTFVLFFSDNGGLSVEEGPHTPATNNYPLRAGKGWIYEGGIREPLIIRYPKLVEKSFISDAVVSSVDFYPTICQLAGANFLNNDGESILPILKGEVGSRERSIFWHYPHYSNQGGRPSSAIRKGYWKLIKFYEDNNYELYNLNEDISERNNIIELYPEKATELKQELEKWLNLVDAKFPEENSNYDSLVENPFDKYYK